MRLGQLKIGCLLPLVAGFALAFTPGPVPAQDALKIGYFDIPPHVTGAEGGKPQGAAISYFEEFIAPRFGVPFEWNAEVTAPTRLMYQLGSGEIDAMIFASKVAKHTKSNTIVLAKNNQLLASGVGQTSRVDALKQAIDKARRFGFDLKGAVMASDAFFPFPDCVEIASKQGIVAVIQPGGSIRDQASIDYCNSQNMSMVLTGIRHFKH